MIVGHQFINLCQGANMQSTIRMLEGIVMLIISFISLYLHITSVALICILLSFMYFYLSILEE